MLRGSISSVDAFPLERRIALHFSHQNLILEEIMTRQAQMFSLLTTFALLLTIGSVQSTAQQKTDMGAVPSGDESEMKNQMTGEQLNQLLASGKTLMLGGDGEGYKGELVLKADGTGKGQAITDNGKTLKIDGTWEIVGDEFCRVWKEISEGKRICERWVVIGENQVRVYSRQDGKPAKYKKSGLNSW